MPQIKPKRCSRLNPAYPLARGLIPYLFNEGTGQHVEPADYHKYRATVDIGVLDWKSGVSGWCAHTDADVRASLGDILYVGQNNASTPYSIVFRVKLSSSSTSYLCGIDVAYNDYIALWPGQRLHFRPEWTHVQFTNLTDFSDWATYVITHNGAGTYKAYKNGKLAQTVNSTAKPFDIDCLFAGGAGDPSGNKFDGDCDFIYFYPSRLLSDVEIALIFREPFCMFGPGLPPAVIYMPAGTTVDIAGTASAQSTVSGTAKTSRGLSGLIGTSTVTTATAKISRKVSASCTSATEVAASLRISRSFATALQSSANITASLSLMGEVGLVGTISSALLLTGKLTSVHVGELFTGSLETERKWLIDALFAGMTANAFKLGTVPSCGWFWMRRSDCSVLYRGPSMERINFANALTVAEHDATTISPPCYVSHNVDSSYFYVVRRFNSCGYQECTLAAAFKVAIDVDGELIESQPNKVFACIAKQTSSYKVQLLWFYCPIEQKSQPAYFNIYYDNKTGQINYQEPLTTISYQGRRFYSFNSDVFEAGKYLFAVRPVDAVGVENSSLSRIDIQLCAAKPNAIDILDAETV